MSDVRVLKPNSGNITRAAVAYVKAGEYAGGGMTAIASAFCTVAGTGCLLGTGEPMFALFYVVPAFLIIVLAIYGVRTKAMSYVDYYHYNDALKNWYKIRGSANEALAKPLIEQIYKCTVEGHPGSGSGCDLCRERKGLVAELVPNKPSDRNDIEAAKRFLEMKKETDDAHAVALKELLK